MTGTVAVFASPSCPCERGNLVKSIIGEIVTYYPNSSYELRVEGTSETELKYYFAGSVRIAVREDEAITWLLADHLGSTSVTVDATGNLLTSLKYTAFGEIRSGDSSTDYQYTGQRNETEIGLYYYVARYYDPELGRFISADTIIPEPGSSQAYDRYAYVNNNPINNNDPSGHCPLCVSAAVGAVVGFVVDFSIQTVPQLLNGTSITNLDINWAETGGAAIAGAISGATMGAATWFMGPAVATAATEGSVVGMAIAGGIGNAAGNAAGRVVQSALETKSLSLGENIGYAKANHDLSWNSAVGDFAWGSLAAGSSQYVKYHNFKTNVPKTVIPKFGPNGTVQRWVAEPLLNKFGNPLTKPSNIPVAVPSIATGLMTLHNYTDNVFTSIMGKIYTEAIQ